MTELFISHWLNKNEYIFDKLSIAWLWVLVINYQRYMAFCPSYNLSKIKVKINRRSTYPKTLNLKARLQNRKVLSTHFTQTESGFLDSHYQCNPFMHDMNDMLHTWKTKSHKSIYECIIFYVKKIQICVVIKKIWFGLEKSDLFL